MSLSNKTDSEILDGLTMWVKKECEAASHVLHYLQQVEERKLFLKSAGTLFEFCMKVHGYSRHEAQARIDAMRLMKTEPRIAKDIDEGKLSLTVAAQVQSSFRKEDMRRKSKGEKALSKDEKKTVIEEMRQTSTRQVDHKLATHFPEELKPEKLKPVSSEFTRIEFNADSAFMKDLERLQALYHHQTGGEWGKLFKILAAREIERLDAPPRRSRGMKSETKSRYVRKMVHQQVWSAWEHGCSHTFENGGRCGSRQNLQKDHIHEYSNGGGSERENLRLLCGPHNRYRSDQFQKIRQDFINRIELTRSVCERTIS